MAKDLRDEISKKIGVDATELLIKDLEIIGLNLEEKKVQEAMRRSGGDLNLLIAMSKLGILKVLRKAIKGIKTA